MKTISKIIEYIIYFIPDLFYNKKQHLKKRQQRRLVKTYLDILYMTKNFPEEYDIDSPEYKLHESADALVGAIEKFSVFFENHTNEINK